MSATRLAPAAFEKRPAAACDARWLERLELEHATLARIEGVAREGDDVVVRRERAPGIELAAGPLPRRCRPPLLLQAASAAAFFAAHGHALAPSELEAARWEGEGADARLWIPRRNPPEPEGVDTAPSASLAAFLRAVFARGERVTQPSARVLL